MFLLKRSGQSVLLLISGLGNFRNSGTTTSASGSERGQVGLLLEGVRVYHGYGKPKHCPKEIHTDKGYDSKSFRISLRSKRVRPVIPRRKWKTRKQSFGRKELTSKSHWQVEHCFSWMQKKYRRLVTRWERFDLYWSGFVQISIIMIWIDKLITDRFMQMPEQQRQFVEKYVIVKRI